MTEFLSHNNLMSLKEGNNWSYILEDEDKFSQLGYKFIQSMNKEGLLKSTKLKHNGQIKLIYFTENYQNLVSALVNVPPHEVWNILGKLLSAIVKIKNNGFLSCENIDIAPEKIYLDAKTYEPHLIYLPLVTDNTTAKEQEFGVELKSNLVLALQMANNALVRDRENELLRILNTSSDNLDNMLKNILNRSNEVDTPKDIKETTRSIELVSTDARIPIRFSVCKNIVSIGRSKDNDVVIDFTKQISRHHCVIKNKNGRYCVVDTSSMGTFVNNKRCIPNEETPLNEGDVLKLPLIQLVVKSN